jgi:hypothetical protein
MPVHAQPVVKSKDNFQTESSYSSDNNPAACAGFAARVAGSEEQPQEHVMEMRALKTGVFSHPEFDHHQTIQFVTDAASGLRAIIAVHDTTLGPALGGCRRWRYDTEQGRTDRRVAVVCGHDAEKCGRRTRSGRREGGHPVRRR